MEPESDLEIAFDLSNVCLDSMDPFEVYALGYEFGYSFAALRLQPDAFSDTVHVENAGRLLRAAKHFGRRATCFLRDGKFVDFEVQEVDVGDG